MNRIHGLGRSLHNACCIFLLAACCHTHNALADIYRWVDENGKVHYTDRKDIAESKNKEAESVSLTETNSSEKPPELDHVFKKEEQSSYQRKLESEAQKQKKYRDEQCKKAVAEYKKYAPSTAEEWRNYHYFVDKNGKSVSEREQQEMVEKMRNFLIKKGCLKK